MKEILITSSVLILAVILLRLMFRNKVSRRLIYGAWLLVALRLLIPVQFGNLNFSVLTPAKPMMNSITDIAQRPISGPSREEVYSDALRDYLSQGGPVFIPEVQEQVESQIQQGRPEQEVYDEVLESNEPESIVLPEINREIETKVSQTAAPTVGEIAATVWIAGMAAMAVWFAAVNLNFRRKLRKTAKPLDLPESKVPVKVSSALTSPCLFGLLKPTVYMTPVCEDDDRMRHHVLIHELTHLRHSDHIWSWVRCICLCIYWFNPLVWVAASLSRRDCELACDEAVLKKLGEGERLAYGKTLLDMVSSVPAPGQLLETATAMHETRKQLKERMKCIVKKPKVFLTAAIILLVVLTVITGCTFSGAFDGPDGPTPDNTQPTTTQTQTTAPTTITTQPTEPPIPTVTEVINCTYSSGSNFVEFFHNIVHYNYQKDPWKTRVTRTAPDGTESYFELEYDFNKKTIDYREDDIKRSFSHIGYYTYIGGEDDDFDILEYILLCNDTEASYLDTIDGDESSAIVVFAQRTTLEGRVENYGEPPEDILSLAKINGYNLDYADATENSLFYTEYNWAEDTRTLRRYDFSGNLISSTQPIQGLNYSAVCELEDGGFVASGLNVDNAILFRCDKDGNEVWRYAFPKEEGRNGLIMHIFAVNNELYTFGYGNGENNVEDAVCMKFSMDGKRLDRKTFGGNDDIILYGAEEIDGGFRITGITRSSEGDFPFWDSYAAFFSADLDYEFNLISAVETDDGMPSSYVVGIMDGKRYFPNDPIFTVHADDKLPDYYDEDGMLAAQRPGLRNIFSYGDGYVIIRSCNLLTRSDFYWSSWDLSGFKELIFTGYDSSGTPLWQFTVPYSAAAHGVLE